MCWQRFIVPSLLVLLAGQWTPVWSQGAATGAPTPQAVAPITFAPLYQNGDVRRALNFTDQQMRLLNDANQRLMNSYQQDLSALNTVTPTERAARQAELQRLYDQRFMQSARLVLQPQQLDRYQQIVLQQRGLGAFTDPAVQQRLGLTQQQIANLVNLSNQYEQNVQSAVANPQAANNAAELRDRQALQLRDRQALQSKYQSQLSTILNPAQIQTWQSMTGAPFTQLPVIIPGTNNPGNAGTVIPGNPGINNPGNTVPGRSGNAGPGNSGNAGPGNSGNTGTGNSGNAGPGRAGNTGTGNSGNSRNTGTGNSGNTGTGNSGNTGAGNSGNTGTGNSGNTGAGNSGVTPR